MIRLRPDKEVLYRRLHAAVWPDVLEQIARSNIRNYSIFLRDGLLFAYYEYVGADHAVDMEAMSADPITQSWWELTAPCQERMSTASPSEHWALMEEVFHTDGEPGAGPED